MSDVGVIKPSISINVSGGSAVLGNVSQGDNNRLDTKQTNRLQAADLDLFYQSIKLLAHERSVSKENYLALKVGVEALAKEPSRVTAIDSLKRLYNQYAWAATPIKALLGALMAL